MSQRSHRLSVLLLAALLAARSPTATAPEAPAPRVASTVPAEGQSSEAQPNPSDPWRVVDLQPNDESEDEVDWPEWIHPAVGEDGPHDLSWSSSRAWAVLQQSPASAARPPVFLVPGIASSRLVNWREKRCRLSTIRPRDVVWLSLGKLLETFAFDQCWLDCMRLGEHGQDPSSPANTTSAIGGIGVEQHCALRPDEGVSAVSVLAPGVLTGRASRVFDALVEVLVEQLHYEGGRSLFGVAYDWRLSPRRMEQRDGTMSKLKHDIEHAVHTNGRPAVVVAHSMGNLVFTYFLDWLRDREPSTWRAWVDRHVWCYVGLGAPLLGAAGALVPTLVGETFGLSISEAQARTMELTFDSTHFINPRKVTSRRHQRARGQWWRHLVRVRPDQHSNRSVAFTVDDVVRGHLFRWLADTEGAAASPLACLLPRAWWSP